MFTRSWRTQVLAVSICAVGAAGCAPKIYKTTASSYVTAGRAAAKTVEDTSAAFVAARNASRGLQIAQDRQCPVDQLRIFVRQFDRQGKVIPNDTFGKARNRFSEVRNSKACGALFKCERGAPGATCRTTCYSAEENSCIVQIDQAYTNLIQPANSPDQAAIDEANAIAIRIDAIEYGRSATIQDKVIGGGLYVLSGYLNALDSLTDDEVSDMSATAKVVSDDINSATDAYTKITRNELSASDKARRDQLTSAITSIGVLSSDLAKLNDAQKKADAIRKLVIENESDHQHFDETISQLRRLVQIESLSTQNHILIDDSIMRSMLARKFTAADTVWERKAILDELASYRHMSSPNRAKDIDRVFEAMTTSHTALVNLVKHPTDEQKRQIANERFSNFLLVAGDIAGTIPK